MTANRKQPPRAFPYYGSKARLAKHYPEPRYDVIVEPFAGAAAYSQRYWEYKIMLCDLDPRVIACWQYLIEATAKDILALPQVHYGLDLNTLNLAAGEHALLEFHNFDGFAHVKGRRVGKRCIWNRYQQRLAKLVHRFSHWEAHCMSYVDIPTAKLTWFIDPPYQFGGEHYECGTEGFSFSDVATFARTRQGQVVVCENMKATWLPFRPLADHKGVTNKITVEAIWTNEP